MQKNPSQLKVVHCGALAGSLDKKFAGCSEESTNANNMEDTTAAATTSSTSTPHLASRNPAPSDTDASGTRNAYLQTFLSKHGADLQATLDKYQDNVLHLLQTGTTAGQNIIPKKMLTKVYEASMTTMTQVNTLKACTGSKALSTQRLKELGSIVKHKAMKFYNAKVAEQNTMEHEPHPDINASINNDVMNANPKSTLTDLQHANKFWQSHLPGGCHILRIEPDGNCFFHYILDLLNHDHGAGHDFTTCSLSSREMHIRSGTNQLIKK